MIRFLAIVHRVLLADHQSNRSTGGNIFPGNTTKLFAGMILVCPISKMASCFSKCCYSPPQCIVAMFILLYAQ